MSSVDKAASASSYIPNNLHIHTSGRDVAARACACGHVPSEQWDISRRTHPHMSPLSSVGLFCSQDSGGDACAYD